ncbi:MAG: DUF4364 family protein [Peptostreptococcaceae bacterium]
MFENSSEELASNKLIILYIIDKINVDLTNSQITQVALDTDIMNYFSLQQILHELLDVKLLNAYKESTKEYYCLTQKGFEILESLIDKIPQDMGSKISNYIKENKHKILVNTEIVAEFIKESDFEFIVNLKVIENRRDLINLKLNVSSEKQALLICNNWKKNASVTYAEIIQSLICEQPTP